ncbi:fluoride efflux transporter CrcB [Aetokthonos hydrillicola Thurmond2011]|jgi:CrcB protein|uniref:Fluoride-specific ion channel FluC n=1 Tax=Aetokthonos hydrillicola Thurmond2011 TaxID=2712845 RepID=A0AAP5M7M4_9CYAN|nr:fluoride efflux transporter CrcB [Aetokthonos hydrillicola]MBO3459212.1 fluoride efflux transporter CrcB [Aetokthonos hydrillicola CCALA 1050]MBW4584171.1 fluoride efflux transporter CrcB [Aetokthonos hydrillicola CCALA 1050]MDR9898296.1 fluoride efflux transporter CrcB [Aetokthonos hydrillicola Thurmond2011]
MLTTFLHKTLGLLSSTNPNLRAPLAIILGAIPGALSRYYLTLLFARWLGTGFPYGTFFINVTGAFIMGFFVTFTLDRMLTSPDLRLLVAVGFLGSYTTFSTYALDTSALLKTGSQGLALTYWLGSALMGFVGLEIGSFLARKIP